VTTRHRPPTIRDVALRAGVSTATVSRVLAGIGNPRPETAAAVLAAAEDLDSRPSGVARSLRMRRTRTLGLIVTDIQNPFFPELVQAADIAARASGYSILLGSAAYDEERAKHYMNLMVDRRVDGMIIASSQLTGSGLEWLRHAPIPAVVVNAEPENAPVTVITSDNFAGSGLGAAHLIGLGHRRIAYIRGSETFTADRPRLEGFKQACRDGGLGDGDLVELRGDGRVEGGERVAAQLLADGVAVTAIACYNDVTAIGVMRALRTAGRRVPADISVVGCDDIDAASWVSPALTTIEQQKAELGRLAVERLALELSRPESAPGPEVIRLPMTLHIRESTGPAPAVAPARVA
jgi:DNA-binding LacI/PurR family transcriptional regulator